VTLGLYLFFAVLGATLVLAVPDEPTVQAWALTASVALPWIGLAGWPVRATRRKGLGAVSDLRLRGSTRQVVVGACAGFGALAAATVVATVVQRIQGSPLESTVGRLADDLRSASPWPVVVLALFAAIGAPVCEEVAFRGLLFGALEKRGWAPWASITGSAAAFALFHLEPARLPVLFVIGLVLGWVRWHTGSTRASIAAHMANNLPGAIALVALAFQ
jgi:membrane protease YdiL (CAAX protease family)